MTSTNPAPPKKGLRSEHGRVAAATTIGTAIEWYDFFLYASVAGMVFNQLMFEPMGAGAATIVSFMTVGLSFLFRPLGAFLAGHFGDRYGRRVVLMVTLIGMGAATTLIGLLPTYAMIGVWAPILLVVLRIVQGISAGGEWGGAALMAVEHAPHGRRGIYGASPQIGVPAGLLMANGMLFLMSAISGDAFMEWGWRVPFLLSVVLIFVGYFIRQGVDESPVFQEIAERKNVISNPTARLFRKHGLVVIVAALVFAGQNAVGYMTTGGYIQSYSTNPEGPLAMDQDQIFLAVTLSGASWLVFTLLAGWTSDKLGRRNTYVLGYLLLIGGVLALFPLVNTGNIWLLTAGLLILTVGLGFTYGQQSALYTEIFPASVRFSGVSITYALGAILGGAFAPTIASALEQATGGTAAITGYLLVMSIIGLLAASLLRRRDNIPLGPEHEQRQQANPLRLGRREPVGITRTVSTEAPETRTPA